MGGYSGTPLAKKLGLREGMTVWAHDAPAHYADLLGPLSPGVRFVSRPAAGVALAHLFCRERAALEIALATCRDVLAADVMVWVSWPKKASKVPTDITEDVIRAVALPLGFVDVKVCAVDEVWSGLKLVVRKALR
ncbi:DUF3052 domain-containing protein [Lysobacter sp. LF1]|uniref:DUF3052 domain-containing protein n=1 Tax=Lysobacter stagni TaxID=3045172 RepID=A0ABT6XD95_9GAMM|nr:DUF3052 domain-containing protein [Lysobacter sp. LF1]MDI9238107.1 DUF3052 domain-containing protein [Lysobacter sp. LF1]